MKIILILSFLISSQVFAADICQFQETWEFTEALEAEGIKHSKRSKNHKRFTFVEKEMIHLTITLQDWLKGVSRAEALENFADLFEGRIGMNAGEILYYSIEGKTYALVHYWPGDNEYGAFYEMKNKAYRLIAEINDSFIECR